MLPISIYTNENIVKVPTTSTISPYLQIIIIKNKPLTPITILNIYMPSHLEDIHLIPEIQDQIHKITLQHPNHITIQAGDFNRDILLQGRTSNSITTPPNMEDQEWARFTQNNGLKVIKNPICFTRQGGHNYTSTSHIDGFYTNTPNTTNLQSHTLTNLNKNSDHYPVILQLAPNTVVIKETTTPTNTPRITYPIPPNNLQNLQTTFIDKQNLAIENLTQILQQYHLTITKWEDAQHKFQEITNSLSQCIEQTCMAPPNPPLPNRVKSQCGFLPRTQQKKLKQQLKIYHHIRKAIRSACQNSHALLHNNSNIRNLQSIQDVNIPPLSTNLVDTHTWVEQLATIGKNAKNEAHKIIIKQTAINYKIVITKYRTLHNIKPKIIHKKKFHPTTTSMLDCLQSQHDQVITKTNDIAREIYITQQKPFHE